MTITILAGQIFLCSNALPATSFAGGNIVHPGCIASFQLEADVNFIEARCLIGGERVITASKINERVFTATLSFERVDWNTIELAFGEFGTAATGQYLTVPTLKSATVDGAGEIVDTDITAGTADSVRAYLSTVGSSAATTTQVGYLTKVAVAPAAETEFQVDDTNTKLVFDTGLAGSVVQYSIDKTYTSIDAIGLPTGGAAGGAEYDNITFSGVISGTESVNGYQIILPKLTRISQPAFSVTGDLTALEIQYRAEVSAGERAPYLIYSLDTAV